MTLLYYVLMCVAHVLSIPFLFFTSFKQKYKESIPARFIHPTNHSKQHYDIWLHACSVGEIQSLQKLIESIPTTQSLFLSVITQTGFNQAKKLYGNKQNITIDYLAFETFIPFTAPTCNKLFVFEAELWLMLFVHAKKSGASTRLINARISTRSFKRYLKFKFFYSYLLKYVDLVLSQSDDDTNRLQILGANRVETLGNIKITNDIVITKHYNRAKRLVIIAASTHHDEEEIIINAFKKFYESCSKQSNKDLIDHADNSKQWLHNEYDAVNIKKGSENPLLIVVPRHPERFGEVYNICNQYFNTLKFSNLQTNNLQLDSIKENILLIDTMGELINLYAISDIVILGGAFVKVGGHNPLEVAHFSNVLISGKEIFNQQSLFNHIYNYYLIDSGDLYDILLSYNKLHISSINKRLNNNMIKRILE